MRSKALLFPVFFGLQILQVKPAFSQQDYTFMLQEIIDRIGVLMNNTEDSNDNEDDIYDLVHGIWYQLVGHLSNTTNTAGTIRQQLGNLNAQTLENGISLGYILENLTDDDSWMWTCLAGVLEDYAYTYNEPEWATLEVFQAVTNLIFTPLITNPLLPYGYLYEPSYLWRTRQEGYDPEVIGTVTYASLASAMNDYPFKFPSATFIQPVGVDGTDSAAAMRGILLGNIPKFVLAARAQRTVFPSELEHYRFLYTISNTAPYVALLPKHKPASPSQREFLFDAFGDYSLSGNRITVGSSPVSGSRPVGPNYNYFYDWLADWNKYQFSEFYSVLSGATNTLNELLSLFNINEYVPENPNQGTQPELAPDTDDFEDPSLTALENTTLDGSSILSDFGSLGSDLLSSADLPGNNSSRLQVIPAFSRAHYWGWTWLETPHYIELDDYVPSSTIRGVMVVVWNIVGALGCWLIARRSIRDVVKGS